MAQTTAIGLITILGAALVVDARPLTRAALQRIGTSRVIPAPESAPVSEEETPSSTESDLWSRVLSEEREDIIPVSAGATVFDLEHTGSLSPEFLDDNVVSPISQGSGVDIADLDMTAQQEPQSAESPGQMEPASNFDYTHLDGHSVLDSLPEQIAELNKKLTADLIEKAEQGTSETTTAEKDESERLQALWDQLDAIGTDSIANSLKEVEEQLEILHKMNEKSIRNNAFVADEPPTIRSDAEKRIENTSSSASQQKENFNNALDLVQEDVLTQDEWDELHEIYVTATKNHWMAESGKELDEIDIGDGTVNQGPDSIPETTVIDSQDSKIEKFRFTDDFKLEPSKQYKDMSFEAMMVGQLFDVQPLESEPETEVEMPQLPLIEPLKNDVMDMSRNNEILKEYVIDDTNQDEEEIPQAKTAKSSQQQTSTEAKAVMVEETQTTKTSFTQLKPNLIDDITAYNSLNDALDYEPVAICDGNLKMKIYISSSQALTFTKDFSAGICDRGNPNIWIEHEEYSKTATFWIDLATCHDAVRMAEADTTVSHFNAPIDVVWNQGTEGAGSNSTQRIELRPQCKFTSEYIVGKVFGQEHAQTSAVIGSDTAEIEDNLQFDFNLFSGPDYTEKTADNALNPNTTNYLEIVPAQGFNMYYLLSVPTACYVLEYTGDAHKVFSIPEDPVCSYDKYHNRQWGSWKFEIDMPSLLGSGTGSDTQNESSHYKLECAMKVCPNEGDNECSALIDDCNYPEL